VCLAVIIPRRRKDSMQLEKTKASVIVGTLHDGKNKTVWGIPVTHDGQAIGVIEDSSNSRVWTAHIVSADKPKYWKFRTRKEAFNYIVESGKVKG
jgi:hypothetical protein